MRLNWNLFKVVCFLQMLATAFFAITAFITLFQASDIYFLFESIAFALMSSLAILALNILGSNYPDKPITGRQKSIFNWLFLLNFLLLTFLFGLVFAEYGLMRSLPHLAGQSIFSLSFELWLPFLINVSLLIFQFIILYGLYSIRRQLYINFFKNKRFEFESEAL